MATSPVLLQLMSDVYEITGRPDLVAETMNAIKRCTLKEHSADDYPSDLTTVVPITPISTHANTFRYSVDITASLAQYRKICTIEEYSADYLPYSGYAGRLKFSLADKDNIFDEYKAEKNNYYSIVGTAIKLKAERAIAFLDISYYTRPIVLTDTYTSWIADRFPYVLQEAAAGEVFKMIGKDDEAAKYKASALLNRLDITKAEIGDSQ